MKTIHLFISLLITLSVTAQNNLLVINVSGNIIAKSINKELKPGIAISSNEKFEFKSKEANAILLKSKTGELYQLNAQKNLFIPEIDLFNDKGVDDELMFHFLKDTIFALHELKFPIPNSLKESISHREYVIHLKISSNNTSISSKQKNSEIIFSLDTLKSLASGYYKAQLCGIKTDDQSIFVFSDFIICLENQKKIFQECSLIINNISQNTILKEEIRKYIYIKYGKINDGDLNFILANCH